jgi:hypothetical protein
MNANQDTVEGYCFTMRELQRIANDELPDSVTDFLVLLDLQARNALEGKTLERQTTIEEQKITQGDD